MQSSHFVCKTENVDDVLIAIETDGTEQGGYRKFLLTVDVGIHHIVDVRSELDPGTFERDDSGRIEFRSVWMNA